MDKPAQWHPSHRGSAIDPVRQKVLNDRRVMKGNVKQGSYPFKGMKLTRAEVEWLLAVHDSEGISGPVDLNDERHRSREGLDLRGAHLEHEDLSGLPLARLRAGLTYGEWIGCTKEQIEAAKVHLQEANFKRANLQEAYLAEANLQQADLWGADLQRASLRTANLQQAELGTANLQQAHLEQANLHGAFLTEANLYKANLWKANLQQTDLEKANLQQADLVEANLQDANLTRADLQGADLEKVTLGNEKQVGPRLVDCHWDDVNLAVIDWSHVKILGDEHAVRQTREQAGLIEYEAAVRANRQLATVLRNQGLNEKADDFAYRAQVLQWQVLQLQTLQQLDQAKTHVAEPGHGNHSASEPGRLNIPRIFLDVFYWPSLVLSSVNRSADDLFPKRIFLLMIQVVFFLYLVLFATSTLCLILLLSTPFIIIWLLGFMPSVAAHVSLMPLPKQRKGLLSLLTLLHLPPVGQFKQDIRSTIQQIIFITRILHKTLSNHTSAIFSSFLDVLAGYGYRPGRTLCWYIVTVSIFAWAYYHIWISDHLQHTTGHTLTTVGSIIFSITAFHGRGFFLAGSGLQYDSQVAILGALEAVIGLLIELSFIATFTGRFFRR